ncbi:hypothetical protein LWI29_006910 [Acer saccharum]|uniref:Reverse transcriptase domain-containing protein n=1 Tax=Acer saccharum TaxID=4024 RepID=A0AA39S347_ACESA|nr:hypothetical protein LWI29_006910 [Acer saccharum]
MGRCVPVSGIGPDMLMEGPFVEQGLCEENRLTGPSKAEGCSVLKRGCSGGLILLWKKVLQVKVLSYSVGHIDARFTMEDGYPWRFSGVYGDPSPHNRVASWDLMGRLSEMDRLPWVCGGDFNEILGMQEKVGGSVKSISGLIRFRQGRGPSNSSQEFIGKLNHCASRLRGWSQLRFRNLSSQISIKNREIENLYRYCENEGVMTEIQVLEKSVEDLLDSEELFWKQHARADWLEARDRNSKFFHAKASARQKKNSILRLQNSEGRMEETEEGMARVLQEFFHSLFQSAHPTPSNISRASDDISSSFSQSQRVELDRDFTAEEVRLAIFDLSPSKAPGPDGFHALFFQKFWHILKDDVTSVCLRILNGYASVKEFNRTTVVLIPKLNNPISPKDFRPIALCSVIYKTITKAIAFRVKPFLQDIVSPNQSAFVPGRHIFDNVLIAFESLHSIAKKKTGNKGLMAIKLDISKAYDRVEWKFLEVVLRKMNFPPRLIELILDCISTTSLCFLLNGKSVCEVQPSRGLRQGCPLSPYLFILCAEAFSCLIKKAENNGRGLGIQCSRGGPLISHMFFADDSILFSRASWECSLSIREILHVYACGSGQEINLQKSKVTFSPNVVEETKAVLIDLLGIEECLQQDQYLGLPTLVGRNKRIVFNDIMERVWKKLRSWKDNYFSVGGKEILIRAVAQAIPNYVMSIFQLLVGLCKDLGSMFSKFWWGSKEGKRKISWVKWIDLCKPKCQGGLNFKDLISSNQSLLAMQAWKILQHPESLIARLLKAKYFKQEEFLQVEVKSGISHVWRSILWGRNLLSQGLKWVVGNGKNIRVFQDKWIPRPSSFRTITPDPGGEIRVADLLSRNLRWWDIDKLNRLLLPGDKELVLSIPISWHGGEDYLAWHFDKHGEYSVHSGYQLAISQQVSESSSTSDQSQQWWNRMWSLHIPPKVKIFIWRAYGNALPSLQNLWQRKVVSSPRGAAADVLMFVSSIHSDEDLGSFCMLAWAIWGNRNSLYNTGKCKPSELMASSAAPLLAEFQRSKRAIIPIIPSVQIRGGPNWLAPPPGQLKINTAATLRSNGLAIGVGVEIRDEKGLVVVARSKQLPGNFTAEIGELIALREGLQLAKFYNMKVRPMWFPSLTIPGL